MSALVDAVVRRLPVLKEARRRPLAVSLVCFVVLLVLRFLYRSIRPASVDSTKRISSRGSRSSRDKKKHSSSGNGSSSGGGSSSSKRRKTDPSLPTILLLVGIHGSGKSFWAKRYTQIVHKSYVIISSDAIRSSLTGTINNYTREEDVEAELLKEVTQTLELRRSCIVDDCQHNLSPNFRAKLKALAADGAVNRVAKVFTAKPSYAMVRIQSDVEEGMVRYVPTVVELETQAEAVAEFERTFKEDGWIEN